MCRRVLDYDADMSSNRPHGDDPSSGTSPSRLFSLASSDARGELVDREGLDEEDVVQIDRLMAAISALRAAERSLSEASRRFMRLGETDMRALHLLIVCENTGTLATAGAIAHGLGISSASTTTLLDRLERAGHIRRTPHPTDRRALVVAIDPATREAAVRTVGRQQAGRVRAARHLDTEEREVVIGFLEDMTAQLSLDGLDWGPPPAGSRG